MQFATQTSMIEYLRTLKKDAPYAEMLQSEFGVEGIPEDAEAFKKEFLFKYLVQGQYLGLEGVDLMSYAKNNVYGFERRFPWVAHAEALATPSNPAPAKQPKQINPKAAKTSGKVRQQHADGSVIFLEHRQVWVAYAEGRIVTTQKTEEKARQVLQTKWNLS